LDLQAFTAAFHALKARGFVPSKRSGPTGVGYTLETELGILENNIATPDLGTVELKAHHTKSSNLITLFTFNRKAWRIPPLEAVQRYGSRDKDGRLGLYYTLSLKPNSAGLFLYIADAMVEVRHVSGEVVVQWHLETLARRFLQKIPAMIFVSAFSEERDGREHFHYYRAQWMQGTSPELLGDQFREERILIDLRLHDQVTRARNHGTAFRTYEEKLPLLFKSVIDL
jgi:hypothetical protein